MINLIAEALSADLLAKANVSKTVFDFLALAA